MWRTPLSQLASTPHGYGPTAFHQSLLGRRRNRRDRLEVSAEERRRPLPPRLAEQLLDEVAVHRHRRRAELPREVEERVETGALRQLLPLLHREPAPPRQRLDRLNAADERARQDPVEAVAGENLDQPLGLPRAPRVERTQPVLALPALPVARARMPDEEQPFHAVVAEGRDDRRVAPVRQDLGRGRRRDPANLVYLLPGAELASEWAHREVADVLAPSLPIQIARVRDLPADLAAVAGLLFHLAESAVLRALVR